jgi:hypothetical protein
MPLTEKGSEILGNLKQEYGSEKKAEQVLYAGKNAGTFTGIDAKLDSLAAAADTFRNRVDMVCDRSDDHRVIGGIGFTPPSGGARPDNAAKLDALLAGASTLDNRVSMICDAWSPEARKAAAEARRKGSSGGSSKSWSETNKGPANEEPDRMRKFLGAKKRPSWGEFNKGPASGEGDRMREWLNWGK